MIIFLSSIVDAFRIEFVLPSIYHTDSIVIRISNFTYLFKLLR